MENNRKNNNPKTSESKSVNKVISEYMERRRERTYKADESFHKAITPDSSRTGGVEGKTVIYRNGIDTRFLIYVIVLLCFGAVMMYSATYVSAEEKFGDGSYFISRYIIFAIAACAVTIPFVMYARPWFWKCFGTVTYVGSAFLLLLVLLNIPGISAEYNGAQRWLDFGFITIQPSEFAKTGDGILTAVQVLCSMVKNNKTLSEMGKVMTKFPQILVNVRVADKNGLEENQAIKDVIAKYQEELGDNGQILVRASGTEPLIRIMAEGPKQEYLEQIAEAIAEVVVKELA